MSVKGKDGREGYDAAVTEILEDHGVDLVLLIGYMRIVSGAFVRRWWNRCLNVHPSLLPDFAGGMDTDVHAEVIKAKRGVSGCTVRISSHVFLLELLNTRTTTSNNSNTGTLCHGRS